MTIVDVLFVDTILVTIFLSEEMSILVTGTRKRNEDGKLMIRL